MWDNPALLRNTSTAMFVVSVLLMVYGAAHYLVHLPTLLPLHSVRLSAAPVQVDELDVLQVVREKVHGNFFTVDIEQLRMEIEKLPWVRRVEIRREFPDRLAIALEEHQAMARWNNDDLVNQQGEVFSAEVDSTHIMPNFIGQPGESELVAQQYAQCNEQLAKVHLQATQIAESPRHSWQLKLNNGMVLELGSEQMQERLARFVTVYPYSLAAMQDAVKTVDLRYRNGFAVSSSSRQS
ncbi:MAG: cell division protein FtsQ/DivIB [Gallionella sp.]